MATRSSAAPPPSQARVRRVFGSLSPSPQTLPLARSDSRSPSRSPLLATSASSQSLDQLSLSGTDDDRDSPAPLTCPICNEDMITLLQLNRHLDDVHREVAEVQKETVKSWLKKRMIKAKSLPPVVALNQKLGKAEPFERNGELPVSAPGKPVAVAEVPTVSDEIVTRKHWQQETGNDFCSEPSCGKFLNNKNGHINCRKCGKLFCESHTMYQIKLSMSAQWEPVRGTWCRVCETCYKTREGYYDTDGAFTDHTPTFIATRQKIVDRTYLEANRLEKRLTKLLTLMANPPKSEPQQTSLLKSLTGSQTNQRSLEQQVVTWQDDESIATCPFCALPFNFSNRKHHCRLCGRVVCGNPATGCSTNVGLNVQQGEKGTGDVSVDVRMCRECKATIFGKRDFARESNKTPKYVQTYQNMIQFRHGIEQLLPKFRSLVFLLKESETLPTKAQLDDAQKTRKRLLDLFTQYDTVSKRLLTLPSPTPTDERVQKAMNQAATHFLQTHMLPLQSLPKILAKGRSPLAKENAPQENGRAVSAAEEKVLKEKMMVLEEQKFLVENMIEQARRGRRMEEVGALRESVGELEGEIDKIKQELGDLHIE